MTGMAASYRLLNTFAGLFHGRAYLHRVSNQGDVVAMPLFEDLYALGRSERLVRRVDQDLSVLNTSNRRHGIAARRGDGSFGEAFPGAAIICDPGYAVARGPIATIEIGVGVKILMKAMIKQIDRVASDLRAQAAHFRSRGGKPICVGIVGINHASRTASYEGDRVFRTDGKKHKHPVTEAAEAEDRLLRHAAPDFDAFLVLRFEAVNESPFPLKWVDPGRVTMDYAADLARISQRF